MPDRFAPTAARLFVVLAALAATSGPLDAASPAVGTPAPAFALVATDGTPATLDALVADGPAVVVVLRGWPGYQCPLCTKQVAAFRAKADVFRAAKLPVLMIYPGPADRLDAHAAEFLQDAPLPAGFRLATDPDFALTNAYGLRWDQAGETAHPATFLVDRGRVVRFAKVGTGHGDRARPEDVLAAARQLPTTRPAAHATPAAER